jgi:CRISPR-associated endonuclease/helicase Cas3
MQFYAHAGRDRPREFWDPLLSHLEATAKLAREFSSQFAPVAGHLVGLWHDLGKFQPEFQDYLLRSCSSGSGDSVRGPEHAIVGAYEAFRRNRVDLAMVIAAHHGGLAQRAEFLNKVERGASIRHLAPADLLDAKAAEFPPADAEALWVRFLFSALVDADSLETEFWDKGVRRWRCEASVSDLTTTLERWLADKTNSAKPSTVNALRRLVQNRCVERSGDEMGAFRLTVPTGGGKTLASLLFALRHARHHNLRRVIVVIPYTSIIDQTVKVFRSIFGEHPVLEHHSNIDPSADSLANRHCVENWDSPIIVTTSVQFFETLHASGKRELRKLHRVAESVVILDEVQTFPLELIKPIKDALDRLVAHFRATTVHCSATQPRLAQREAREIVPEIGSLFGELRHRVRVTWPDDPQQPTTWQALAGQIRRHPGQRVLAIVHRKRDAIDLALAVGVGCLHL